MQDKVCTIVSCWPFSNPTRNLVSRAERIHSDLLYFLGDASKAYNDHFSSELQKMGNDDSSNTSLGPAIVLFHETRYTNVLAPSVDRLSKSPETVIRDRLVSLSQVPTTYIQQTTLQGTYQIGSH
jgi:zinc finger FYVE domain-containing protein 1